MKAFLKPYLNSIESLQDLIMFEKNNLFLLSVIYYFVSGLMLLVAIHLFPGKFFHFASTILGLIYLSNVVGFFAGATLAYRFSLKAPSAATYAELEGMKKGFYLTFYLLTGIPFMALIAWAIVYADLRFALEMILAFVATTGAMYFGDWKSFQSFKLRLQ